MVEEVQTKAHPKVRVAEGVHTREFIMSSFRVAHQRSIKWVPGDLEALAPGQVRPEATLFSIAQLGLITIVPIR